MSEETQFWGVVVEGYNERGYPASVLLRAPKSARGYPVFSSRGRADKFVREQGPALDPQLVEQTRADIRRIKRNEISGERYVSLDGTGSVPWAELLEKGE